MIYDNIDYEPISLEEEHELRERIANGDDRAKQTLIEKTLRKVMFHAWQYQKKSPLTVDELFQEGCIGLMVAADTFDYADAEYRFATFAKYRITAYMHDATRKALKNQKHESVHRDGEFFAKYEIEDESAQDAFTDIEEKLSLPDMPNIHKMLPPELSYIVQLRHGLYDGYQLTFKEIASATDLSSEGVRHRYHRAMSILKGDNKRKKFGAKKKF